MHSQELKSLTATLLRNSFLASYVSGRADELPITRVSFDDFRVMIQGGFTETLQEEDVQYMFASYNEEAQSNKIRTVMVEMAICRNVEAVDFYLTQMLRKMYTQRPEVLKAKDFSVQMSEVLQCSTIDEVILRVADRKIQELSYRGLSDIIKYLNSIHGLNYDTTKSSYINAQEVFQTRNIIVHNADIVNEVYLKNTTRTDLKVGEVYPLTDKYLVSTTASLIIFTIDLDKQFVSHFKIS